MALYHSRPVIGVLLDYEAEGSFSSRPYHALRLAYFDAIESAGGTPVAFPYLPNSIDAFLEIANGVVLPGGFYPFPATYYGQTKVPGEKVHPRAAFEMDFTRRLLAEDVPVLGICAGMQALATALGATIHRDVHTAYDTTIDHLNEKPAEEFAHSVSVTPGTLLHRIIGCDELLVNTAHREGVDIDPDGEGIDGLEVNARAPDGVVEGLEIISSRFALGVQWHPEFFLEPGNPHRALFEALVMHAAETGGAGTQIKTAGHVG